MRLILAAAVTAAMMSSAHAQDAAYDWSGAYLGAQVGYESDGRASYVFNNNTFSPYNYSHGLDGFLGGGYGGYNHQFSNGIIVGGEADITWGSIKDASRAPGDPAFFATSKLNWSASARIRLGYAIDRVLPYVAGGVTFGRFVFDENGPALSAGSATVNLDGWNLGAGADFAVTDNWIVRGELTMICVSLVWQVAQDFNALFAPFVLRSPDRTISSRSLSDKPLVAPRSGPPSARSRRELLA